MQPVMTQRPYPEEESSHQAPVVLRFAGLSKAFDGHRVLDDVEGQLHRGEVVLLRGDNGSGKTTLLNILTGILHADAGSIDLWANGAEEHFHFPRRWYHDINPFDHFTPERVAWEGVGRTWQEVRLFGTQTLRNNLAVARRGQTGESPIGALLRPRKTRLQEVANQADAEAMLADLGLAGRGDSSADRISLGQSKRVAIARAVRAGARMLFLDEPLAGLDGAGIDQVLGLLHRLAREESITMVVVEHVFHIPRMLDMADTVWTLNSGHVAVEDPHKVRKEYEGASGEGLREWLWQLAGNERVVRDYPLGGHAVLSLVRRDPEQGRSPLLEVRDLMVRRGPRLVIGRETPDGIDGLSFALNEGDLAVLRAPNGWGKTTLVEALAGMLPVERGALRVRGREVSGIPPWSRARLGLSFLQSRNAIFPNLLVEEALQLAGVLEVPAQLQPLAGQRMGSLSGGERQRVALACALAVPAGHAVVLDEPFGMLDDERIRALQQDIAAAVNRGCAVIVAVPGY